MINFRYHVVSIAAILLALAAGIALGSGVLDDSDAITADDPAQEQVADPAIAAFESSYVARTSRALLDGALDDKSVVIMTVPGARVSEIRGVTTALKQAGAEVTGQIELSAKLLDPASRQFAEGVAQQSAPDVDGVNAAGDSYGRIGAALGRAFVADKAGPIDATATTIRSAFTEGDLISATSDPSALATLIVLVTGPAAGSSESSDVVAALSGPLGEAGAGIVVAGPTSASDDGGAVKAVRDGDAAAEVSTVDVTDTPAGRVVTALALEREADGDSGAWGTTRSADGAMPD